MAQPLAENFPQELRDAYDVVSVLGRGAFGEVYRARPRLPRPASFPKDVAIKVVRVSANELDRQLLLELITHFKCYSAQVVTALDIVFVPGRVALIMELVPGGDLFSMVQRSRRGLPEDKARWIFQQLVLGVFYLHELNVAQRDIKLENVLVVNPESNWPRVKITDFGYSRQTEGGRSGSRVGTPGYMAPEVLSANGHNLRYSGRKADMWSCGIMLYVMLFCRYPFQMSRNPAAQDVHELERLMRGDIELPDQPHISEVCLDLLRHLITPDPDERFSAEQCMSHPWFQQNLPANAIEQTHDYVRRTEQRWAAGRRRDFERKMRRRGNGPPRFGGFLNRFLAN